MNEMELYFARQNLSWNIGLYIWNIGLYIMLGVLILCIGIFLYDIGSRIYWKIYDWRKERRNKR